jgi:phosphoribosyl 1,2-cyclic phosphodiesterase
VRVRFWGTRGSLPAPLNAQDVRAKVREVLKRASGRAFEDDVALDAFLDGEFASGVASTFGGNTSCVQIDLGGGELIVCDAGSGLRELGRHLMTARGPAGPLTINLFMSHLHWDHVMGFPFFAPAYVPGNRIRIHGCHPVEEILREAFRRQQSAPCFPVDFDRLGAAIEFVPLEANRPYAIGGCEVSAVKQLHAGDSYGYRFEHGGKVAVYATDAEHKPETVGTDNPSYALFRNADLVIFDAMYSLAESVSVKEDWGHSSNIVGVELCHLAGVKTLCLFHHEPAADDGALVRVLEETRRFEKLARRRNVLEVIAAYDGLELTL